MFAQEKYIICNRLSQEGLPQQFSTI